MPLPSSNPSLNPSQSYRFRPRAVHSNIPSSSQDVDLSVTSGSLPSLKPGLQPSFVPSSTPSLETTLSLSILLSLDSSGFPSSILIGDPYMFHFKVGCPGPPSSQHQCCFSCSCVSSCCHQQ